MAHELGHSALDFSPRVDAKEAAHRFAGGFLMPAEALWAMLGNRRTSIGWSHSPYDEPCAMQVKKPARASGCVSAPWRKARSPTPKRPSCLASRPTA